MAVALPVSAASRIASRFGWPLLNALQLAFTLAVTAGGIVLALLLRVPSGTRLPLRMASRLWAPALLGGAGARLEVHGADAIDWSRPTVIVANHASMIDICALFAAVPVPLRFVLKQEMARVPFVGQYAKAMGMVFIRRGASRDAARSLAQAAQRVREGACVCVFPEGTRSRNGQVGPFKPGAFEIALASGAQIVPVALSGTGAVLPAHGFRVRPGRITLRFGAPLAAEGERAQLAVRARAAVTALLGQE